MNHPHDDDQNPRWLKLASALRAEPAPGTMPRVRARLEQRTPLWLTWLARPATLAVSAGLLVASAWFGASLVPAGTVPSSNDGTLAAALLEDDGSFGLILEGATVPGEAGTDSQDVTP